MTFLLAWIAALAGMEGVAWACHRWLMHGPLWFLHASHHRPYAGRFQANDWFGVFFAIPSIALIALGITGRPLLLGLGLGMTNYGLLYLLFHDALVHGRFGHLPVPRNAYVARLVRAHRRHHGCLQRDGARHFGFLWAPAEGTALR
jgi:beta-carotene 3-hydroxylase